MVGTRRMLSVGAATAVVIGGAGAVVATTPFAGDTAHAAGSDAAGSDAAGSDAAGCSTGQLPGYVMGRPAALSAGAPAGDYIWHNDHGSDRSWHIAVTHSGDSKVVFTGTVHASRPIEFVEVRDERRDVVSLSGDRLTLTYRFTNYGHLDGLRFRADCAKTVHFSLAAAGHELSPARVFLGADGRRPSSNPFAIERR